MRTRLCRTQRLFCLLTLAFPVQSLLAQEQATQLPDGVTEKMISDGENIFKGPGACTACHGPEAKGIPGLGANLTDTTWLHSDGSFQGILHTITTGTTSSAGVAMPPRGGTSLSDDQVKAVAAYIWSLSHRAGLEPSSPKGVVLHSKWPLVAGSADSRRWPKEPPEGRRR